MGRSGWRRLTHRCALHRRRRCFDGAVSRIAALCIVAGGASMAPSHASLRSASSPAVICATAPMPAARHHRRWRGSYAPLLLCRLRGIIVVGAGHMRHCSYAGCAASSSSSGRAGPNRRPAGSDCRAPHRAVPARIVARQGLIAGLLIGPCRPESSPGRAKTPRGDGNLERVTADGTIETSRQTQNPERGRKLGACHRRRHD